MQSRNHDTHPDAPLKQAQCQTNLSEVCRDRFCSKSEAEGRLCRSVLLDNLHHEETDQLSFCLAVTASPPPSQPNMLFYGRILFKLPFLTLLLFKQPQLPLHEQL